MSGQRHTSEAQCPTCGHDEAIVRVRGNAFSAVCTSCGRADVTPLLNDADLLAVEGETYAAELFELEAVRTGQSSTLAQIGRLMPSTIVPSLDAVESALQVELRLPVPPR